MAKWKELSRTKRAAILVGGAVDLTLRAAAIVDVARRPKSQVRGPKQVWIAALSTVNSAGLLPVGYFLVGRKK